jgi:hypothetical protein
MRIRSIQEVTDFIGEGWLGAGGFETPHGNQKSARILNDFNGFSNETTDSARR